MTGRDNGNFFVQVADDDYFKECLAFNYAKLIFWFVSFAAIIVFVYLYTKDMRERFIKSDEMLAALEMENKRLNKTHGILQRKITGLEVAVMQKNAQIAELEYTAKELRKSFNAV